jgi:hypothetical protein
MIEQRKAIFIGDLFNIRTYKMLFILIGISISLIGLALLLSDQLNKLILSELSRLMNNQVGPDWPRNLKLYGAEAIIEGGAIVIFGALVLPRWDTVLSLIQKKQTLIIFSITTLVVFWLPVVLFARSTFINGQQFWWLGDDAMISMRYGRNLAHGLGLVWNAGQRVEGYSNFLWTLYMAFVHLFPLPASKTSLVILISNIVLACATIPAIIGIVKILGGRTLAVAATLVAYVLSRDSMYWSSYGFETVLLTFMFTLALYRVLQDIKLGKPRLTTYLLISITSLVRADSLVLSFILYGISFLMIKQARLKIVLFAGLSLLLPIAQELFRIYYYGDILPNTAYLKAVNWNGKILAGFEYTLKFVIRYAFLWVFALIGALSEGQWNRRILLGGIILYAGYVTYVGGDAFIDFRFYVPVIPVLIALAFIGVQDIKISLWGKSLRPAFGALCLLTVPLIFPGYAVSLFPYSADVGNVKIGLYLKQNTPESSKVADFWAGSVFYFSDRYGIDLLGKSDRVIARMPVASGGLLPGHNKFNFEYSLGKLKPDYVVSHFRLPVTDEQMRLESTGNFAYIGQLYFDPIFREHCFPYPLNVDTWRTIFACHW